MRKIDIKAIPHIMQGMGRVDDTRPINMQEYVIAMDSIRLDVQPVKITHVNEPFSMKIGGTTFNVATHFNPNGRQSVLGQFKELILSEHLI